MISKQVAKESCVFPEAGAIPLDPGGPLLKASVWVPHTASVGCGGWVSEINVLDGALYVVLSLGREHSQNWRT